MKRLCSTCKHETGLLKCNAKHTRWKDARFNIVSLVNCPDWQRRNGVKKEALNDINTTARAVASHELA